MEKEIIEQIITELEKSTAIDTKDKAKFSDPDYQAIDINENNFSQIKKQQGVFCFIDGGNQEIIQAANFSLQLIRIYYNVFKNNKKITAGKKEFFILIKTGQNNLNFSVNVFGPAFPELENLSFDSMDKTLRTGNHRILITKIGDVVRRYAEILFAAKIELEKNTIIVLDGDLKANNENDKNLLDTLYKKTESTGTIVAALSKTTSLLTEKGNSFGAVIQSIAPAEAWLYHPIVKINNEYHQADLAFLKLHKMAKRIFKLEFHNGPKKIIAAALAFNATDPTFLGYPYGLIDADRFARISNNEKEILKTEFMAKLGKKWKNVEGFSSLLDAHRVLDSIG